MAVKVLGLGVKMKRCKGPLTCYVLLLMCTEAAIAQFIGQQSQFAPNAERGTQLSPQQQGQILSDIQQHHRFNVPPNQQPQHFTRHEQQVSQDEVFNQQTNQRFQNNPQFLNQPQESLTQSQSSFQQHPSPLQYNQQQNTLNQQFVSQNRQQFAQNQFLSTLPLVNALPQSIVPTQQSQLSLYNKQNSLLPTSQTVESQLPTGSVPSSARNPKLQQDIDRNRIIQHHTQTNFQPNFISQPRAAHLLDPSFSLGLQQQIVKPRPTIDPIIAIEEQIKNLDPDKHKQKIKELREKQAIIEKHNQFVERQYEKALKKAQQEHEEFAEQQREQKKKLYQKVHRPPGTENLHYSHTSIPRYIYPEEVSLFEQAVKQYYQEHPTTTTTTTTTTTPPPKTTTTRRLSKKGKTSSFLPTAIPAASTKLKTIQSIDDLDQLQKEYKSQKIRKDDLLEQLRLAIGRQSEDDPKRNISSREISLANGKKIQIIEANDPKDIPYGREEEITLPNGEKVTVIRADDPNTPQVKQEEITLPSGKTIQVIKTTDPKAVQESDVDVPQEITLPNGQKAQLIKTSDPKLISAASAPKPVYKTEEITLPNGEKVEVIKTTDPSLVPGGVKIEPGSELEKLVLSRTTTTTTTIKPPKDILEELTKGVPASNFELLKTGATGGLESVGKTLPNQKKVTFVLLEEQSDGTLKVQGIKGNGKDKPEVDIDSILKKLKEGQIKLPRNSIPTTTITTTTTTKIPHISPTYRPVSSVTISPNSYSSDGIFNTKFSYTPTASTVNTIKSSTLDTSAFTSQDSVNVPILKTNIGTQTRSTSSSSSSLSPVTKEYSTTRSTTPASIIYKDGYKKPTRTPHILNYSGSSDLIRQASTVSSLNQNSVTSNNFNSASTLISKPNSTSLSSSPSIYNSISTTKTNLPNIQPTQQTIAYDAIKTRIDLPDILKKNGLFAMAKFLKQSGLDTILNETGPYTIFVPTDKAFRTLLVQLGGPEKAEEKFKENPRLLSGLLLHHVIPGAFTIGSLQDEMTGVSLAGTQLRVNQYNMHDLEWNDVKITTINGAKVLEDKKDIEIPQGIAHSIDKVMFPLPVGDIVQTLQSDRERRFTNFLRAIFASGLVETLQGSKTFTLFAPTDKAFAGLSSEELSRTVADKILARELVLRHLLAGTFYTNGMRYYQIKDSLLQDRQLTFSKQTGKVKVNNIQVATQNIPTTNGVIHAIDSLL